MERDEDLYEARRDVLKRLIASRFDGNKAAFAEAAGLSPSYVNRMLKRPGEPHRKRIGDDTALKIEGIQEMGLSPGMLLNPTLTAPARAGIAALQDRLSPDEAEAVRLLRCISSAALRMKALGFLQGLAQADGADTAAAAAAPHRKQRAVGG